MKQKFLAFLHRGPYAAAVRVALLALAVLVALSPLSYFAPPIWHTLASITCAALLFIGIVLLNRLRAKLDDTSALIGVEAAIKRLGWVPHDFFTDGAAGSPTLQLFHIKVLSLVRPQSILELGSGQTTKLISAYVEGTSGASAISIEQSQEWHDILRPAVSHDYRVVPVRRRPVEGVDVLSYEIDIQNQKFNYVLVDGPDNNVEGWRFTPYSRAGIVDQLPQLLAPSFVVVFDDAERPGERQTVDFFSRRLVSAGIAHKRFELIGIKHQAIFVSPDLAFLQSV